MKLLKAKIKNFRCYQEEISINFENLTALIGKNDAGKSTVLEALEVFFNNKVTPIDRDDLNKRSQTQGDLNVEITCVFGDLPNHLVIDAANPTTLGEEYLLNQEGYLEIKKVYPCTSAKPKEQVFIVAAHPSNPGASDLLLLKQAELKKRAQELGIDTGRYNARINSSIRRAIWQNFENLELQNTDLPVDKAEAKQIWGELSSWLPVYALFQSDRKSREDDKEVTDPMKIAINQALQEVNDKLIEIQKAVKERAVEVAERTLDKLREMNPDLANELIPDFKTEPKWNSIFNLTLASDNAIPINKRGSGIRRLIVLNFFRAEAERRRQEVNNPSVIYAFEEPETSQHPDHQKLLIEAFQELASAENTQVLITTHTPALGGLIENESLRFVTKDEENKVVIRYGDSETYQGIAATLGVLPEPTTSLVKLLVCVEGPNDIAFLKNISPLITSIDSSLPDIGTESSIIILPLGGGTLKQWVTNNYLRNLGLPEFHIYDRDDKVSPQYLPMVEEVLKRGGNHHATLTKRREAENYIHYEAINRTLAINMKPYTENCDVPAIVAQATHEASESPHPWEELDQVKKDKKVSKAKKRLNYEVASQMTEAEFLTSDPEMEIIGWFRGMKERMA
jgi:putative ATP-dependent endonuclease of OLD family